MGLSSSPLLSLDHFSQPHRSLRNGRLRINARTEPRLPIRPDRLTPPRPQPAHPIRGVAHPTIEMARHLPVIFGDSW
ncbi:MAG: hypothetical protein ACE5R6_02055 [Candidatus Heimdallarchaeota archaeon]